MKEQIKQAGKSFQFSVFKQASRFSSHSVTADLSVGDTAEAAEFFLADGVIVTGGCTGQQANPQDVRGKKLL